MDKSHIFSVLVQNCPGVLSHIAGMFAARGFNIDSLVVGRTEDPAFSRMVIVTGGDDVTLEQIRKQLGKIVTVVKVRDLYQQECVARDLLLIQLQCPPEKRIELMKIAETFRGTVVDVSARTMIVQLTGPEAKIEAFIELCRPYGIKQLSRTGVIAMPRSNQTQTSRHRAVPVRERKRTVTDTTPEPSIPLPPS